MHFLIVMLLLALWPTSAEAARGRFPGPFPVEVLAVRDGDTVEVRFRDGPCGRAPCPGQELLVRILGIDAPEAHRCGQSRAGQRASGGSSCAACEAEWRLGRSARAELDSLLQGAAARVSDIRPDKYGGRIVANIEVLSGGSWRSAADHLQERGLAVAYDGGRKSKPWCKAKRRKAADE